MHKIISLEEKFNSNIFFFSFFLLDKKEFRSRRDEGTPRDELILACQPWTIAHPYSSLIAGVKDGGQPRQPTFTTFLRVSSRTSFYFLLSAATCAFFHTRAYRFTGGVTGIINNRWRGIIYIVLPSTAGYTVRVTRVALMSYLYHWHVHSRTRVLVFNGFIGSDMICN